mmetsp:Transcript_4693/g.9429  ORF Transcript_4693/g.9429 Transcript_4693/m.9429 type:complete len:96 (+) Transcript_4693:803-1090(+)
MSEQREREPDSTLTECMRGGGARFDAFDGRTEGGREGSACELQVLAERGVKTEGESELIRWMSGEFICLGFPAFLSSLCPFASVSPLAMFCLFPF